MHFLNSHLSTLFQIKYFINLFSILPPALLACDNIVHIVFTTAYKLSKLLLLHTHINKLFLYHISIRLHCLTSISSFLLRLIFKPVILSLGC
nr:MAG TPA: hypothetical protein [Caudoviricetes sp.]